MTMTMTMTMTKFLSASHITRSKTIVRCTHSDAQTARARFKGVSCMETIMKFIFFTLIFMLTTQIVNAENFGWLDRDGSLVPNTDAMKSIDGFGGWLVVTSDKDWEEKWNTPTENIPHFKGANNVSYGEELTVLIFFTNPKAGDAGEMNLTCDIQVIRPDKSYSIDVKEYNCANWDVPPSPHNHNVQLTQAIIKYIGEEKDLPGEWKVNINLKDKNAGIEIPLKTKFNLINEDS